MADIKSSTHSGVISAVKPGIAGTPTAMNNAKKGMSEAQYASIAKSAKVM